MVGTGQQRSGLKKREEVLTSIQSRGHGELLAYSEMVSRVDDVVDTVTLGNQVHLERRSDH